MLKILIITIIFIGFAFAGLGIRLLFHRPVRGTSCQANTPELQDRGIGCGCGGGSCSTD